MMAKLPRWVLWESCQHWKNTFFLQKPQTHLPILPDQDRLSVVLSNPSTTARVLEITGGCQEFMLVVHNVQQPVLCCGDGVSVEHMAQCFHARCNGATPVLHLEQAVDALVEFQKEIVFQQVNRHIIITFKHSLILVARDGEREITKERVLASAHKGYVYQNSHYIDNILYNVHSFAFWAAGQIIVPQVCYSSIICGANCIPCAMIHCTMSKMLTKQPKISLKRTDDKWQGWQPLKSRV